MSCHVMMDASTFYDVYVDYCSHGFDWPTICQVSKLSVRTSDSVLFVEHLRWLLKFKFKFKFKFSSGLNLNLNFKIHRLIVMSIMHSFILTDSLIVSKFQPIVLCILACLKRHTLTSEYIENFREKCVIPRYATPTPRPAAGLLGDRLSFRTDEDIL